MAYKIQNRTTSSRRVKITKNGGTITFEQTQTPSYVENDREAGFCLTAITALPDKDSPEKDIYLTAHPMGTDGRVSLFKDGTLSDSIRYSNQAKITDRQTWFNQQFGSVVTYTGTTIPKFTAIDNTGVYRLVFEDDDLDYLFNDVGVISPNTNPTLTVEQYRLAFDLKLTTIEISCDGALNETNPITLEGMYQLEVNGELVTTEDVTVEELINLLEQHNLKVTVYPDPDE